MSRTSVVAVLAGAIGAVLTQPVFGGNLLTNGNFEDFLGPFNFTSAITTSPTTWDKWRVWPNFTSVWAGPGLGQLQQPTAGTTPFPAGWTDVNFAQHWITEPDVTDQLTQGIDGATVHQNKPVTISFQYINTEQGRDTIVRVFGIDSGQSWSEFAPWDCTGCTLLYSHTISGGSPSPQVWTTFTDSFTPSTSHTAVAIGIQVGGHQGYARGVDNVVLSQNEPPDCSGAKPSVATLWPPNHSMIPISILGVTDPDGDTVTIDITAIRQDESVNGLGDGDTSPDGTGIGTSTAKLRAERAGGGNGRVYHVSFTADDGNGGECNGTVLVSVPSNMGPKGAAVDGGPLYDSTTP